MGTNRWNPPTRCARAVWVAAIAVVLLLPAIAAAGDSEIEAFLAKARSEITAGNYAHAIQLLTRLVQLPESNRSAEAQELLGMVRERNGQLAQAKAEYQTYLQKYPQGEGAVRVRQRLAALLSEPKSFGSVSTYYYRNQGSTQLHEFSANTTSSDNQTFQNALVTSLDINGSTKTGAYSLQWRLQGEHETDFTALGGTTLGVSRAYAELSFPTGYSAKLGRQSLNSSGVFGRFDGALLSWGATSRLTARAVVGSPVESVRDGLFASSRLMFGAAVDLKNIRPNLDGSFYLLDQRDGAFTDRRAVGIEGKYLDDTTSLYGMLDYDIYFDRLNSIRLSGTRTLPDQASVSARADFVHSPTLALSDALQGQTATTLQQLAATYSLPQMQQLALDRTTTTSSVTLAYSKPLNDTWQMSFDGTLCRTSGNPASGVPAIPAPGLEYYVSAQVVGSGIFRQGDVVSASARYANTASSNLFLVDTYTRYSFNKTLRIKPRLKVGNREIKSTGGNEIFATPSVTAEYSLNDQMSFEMEIGGRISSLNPPAFALESNELFAIAGVRFEY